MKSLYEKCVDVLSFWALPPIDTQDKVSEYFESMTQKTKELILYLPPHLQYDFVKQFMSDLQEYLNDIYSSIYTNTHYDLIFIGESMNEVIEVISLCMKVERKACLVGADNCCFHCNALQIKTIYRLLSKFNCQNWLLESLLNLLNSDQESINSLHVGYSCLLRALNRSKTFEDLKILKLSNCYDVSYGFDFMSYLSSRSGIEEVYFFQSNVTYTSLLKCQNLKILHLEQVNMEPIAVAEILCSDVTPKLQRLYWSSPAFDPAAPDEFFQVLSAIKCSHGLKCVERLKWGRDIGSESVFIRKSDFKPEVFSLLNMKPQDTSNFIEKYNRDQGTIQAIGDLGPLTCVRLPIPIAQQIFLSSSLNITQLDIVLKSDFDMSLDIFSLIFSKCPKLVNLNFNFNNNILNDADIKLLFKCEKLNHLQYLTFVPAIDITIEAFYMIVETAPNIKYVDGILKHSQCHSHSKKFTDLTIRFKE